ncbi:MAG: MarR family winged helix-turn-helix transcriptional regulator [Desulfopila sp.]
MKCADPEHNIGFLIYEVSRLMRLDFHARVEPVGLTQSQWRAISHIARQEGCNQATLAETLEVKPITLSRLVDKLVDAGWIERRPDPQDRRAVRLYLSAKAHPLMRIMQEKAGETRKRALQNIGEKEFDALFTSLKTMKSNLSS